MTSSVQKTKKLKNLLIKTNPDSKVYLFGSHAKNEAKDSSDIDVAIISSAFHDYWEDRKNVETLAAQIDDSFEIHLFKPSDFDNPYDPLVAEVKKYGVLI